MNHWFFPTSDYNLSCFAFPRVVPFYPGHSRRGDGVPGCIHQIDLGFRMGRQAISMWSAMCPQAPDPELFILISLIMKMSSELTYVLSAIPPRPG